MLAATLVSLALAAAPVEERLDHRGAVGLLIGVGGLRKESSVSIENTWRGAFNLGVTFPVGFREHEIVICASTSMTRTEVLILDTMEKRYGFGIDAILWGGYRAYFGEAWKTYVDVDLALGVVPGFTAGPRFGIGLMHELSSVAGIFTNLHAQLGFGSAIVFRVELAVGVQLRSFLLED